MSVSKAVINTDMGTRRIRFLLFMEMLVVLLGAGNVGAAADSGIVLNDVTKQTGIMFEHTDGSSGEYYIVETVSAGLALFDYDNDGDVDIYFLNGSPLKGAKFDKKPRNALYRNDGEWKFTDVTKTAGVGDTGYGLGIAVADYDNDGDQDIYLNNYGPNVLYRNNGDGTFQNVTTAAGVADGSHTGAGTCFLDMDKDGDLDLFVSR
ncbi:MAG: FG-GAP repeat domain-containing protein, partial [Planctomycetota bacterium]